MANKLTRLFFYATFVVALSFSFERQAHAYVDPGSGLLMFQGLSAVFSGTLFYFRRRIKSLFSRTPDEHGVDRAVPLTDQ